MEQVLVDFLNLFVSLGRVLGCACSPELPPPASPHRCLCIAEIRGGILQEYNIRRKKYLFKEYPGVVASSLPGRDELSKL